MMINNPQNSDEEAQRLMDSLGQYIVRWLETQNEEQRKETSQLMNSVGQYIVRWLEGKNASSEVYTLFLVGILSSIGTAMEVAAFCKSNKELDALLERHLDAVKEIINSN